MSYDVLLSRTGAPKLSTFVLSAGDAEEGFVEDDTAQEAPETPIEQPLPPHMPLPLRRSPVVPIVNLQDIPIEEPLPPHMPLRRINNQTCISHNCTVRKQQPEVAASGGGGGTPSRKISSSSKIMNAFSQFYGADSSSTDPVAAATEEASSHSSSPATTNKVQQRSYDDSFPEIKGRVESKLMSMWHNVKYGWSGKIRSNFSKEQPVWLLGRCYHRKFSPISSMENSAEMTASLENKLYVNELPSPPNDHLLQHPDEQYDPTVQEFGTDAIEGEHGEYQWEEGIEGFKRDFYSRLWMTYRREFPTMNGSNYTSDCGWGCMLRSGQMLLAQAMICHFLGRGWRWDPDSQLHSTHEDNMHRKIIRWFGDSSSKNSPFSIHTLVTLGQDSGKKAGDWYGPSFVSHLMKQAVKLASQENADFDDIHVYVAQDCTVYIQDIFDECLVPDPPAGPIAPWQNRNKSPNNLQDNMHWKALILLVPLRLGAEKLNPIYGNSLKSLLGTDYCIGIIGGRPKHSLYFVGFQEDKLIHLDPHYCQEMVDVNQENFLAHSFHCKSPRKLKLSKLDPSCCIGFYCQTRNDFDNFVASVQPYLLPVRNQAAASERTGSPINGQQTNDTVYPMFVFSRSRRSEQQNEDIPESAYKILHHMAPPHMEHSSMVDDDEDDETEEFVII